MQLCEGTFDVSVDTQCHGAIDHFGDKSFQTIKLPRKSSLGLLKHMHKTRQNLTRLIVTNCNRRWEDFVFLIKLLAPDFESEQSNKELEFGRCDVLTLLQWSVKRGSRSCC